MLIEDLQIKKHVFRFMGDGCNYIRKGVSGVRYNGLKIFNCVKWRFGSVRYWIVSGDINNDGNWVLSRRVQYGGPDIQRKR